MAWLKAMLHSVQRVACAYRISWHRYAAKGFFDTGSLALLTEARCGAILAAQGDTRRPLHTSIALCEKRGRD